MVFVLEEEINVNATSPGGEGTWRVGRDESKFLQFGSAQNVMSSRLSLYIRLGL